MKFQLSTINKIEDNFVFRLYAIHKKKGQCRGKIKFETYAGAKLYLNKVVKPHNNYKNYIIFCIEKEKA